MARPFVFGLVGGILGILAGVLIAVVGSFLTFLAGIGIGVLIAAIIGIAFSLIGMVASRMEWNRVMGGALMIISGAIVLLTLNFLGILTFILFLVGGILLLTERRPQTVGYAQPVGPSVRSTNPYAQTASNEPIQFSQDRCQLCNSPVTMEQEYCINCGAELKLKR